MVGRLSLHFCFHLSLSDYNMDPTCIYMYKKKLALNNIYPVHQLTIVLSMCEHCGRSVQKFW